MSQQRKVHAVRKWVLLVLLAIVVALWAGSVVRTFQCRWNPIALAGRNGLVEFAWYLADGPLSQSNTISTNDMLLLRVKEARFIRDFTLGKDPSQSALNELGIVLPDSRVWALNYYDDKGGPAIFDGNVLLVEMPFWTLALPLALLATWIWWRERKRVREGHCLHCGYNLTGNVSGTCPECGNTALSAA